jgi:hypothetical protein
MKMATWVKSYDHLKPNEAKKGVWHPCVTNVIATNVVTQIYCVSLQFASMSY